MKAQRRNSVQNLQNSIQSRFSSLRIRRRSSGFDVVRCYLRLSDNHRAKEALRQCLPDQLKDTTFAPVLREGSDQTTKRWLAQLVKNLEESNAGLPKPPVPRPGQMG
jgi:hypothetical protein